MTTRCTHPDVGPNLKDATSEADALTALAIWESSASTDADPFAMPSCPDCGEGVGVYLTRREPLS